MCGGGAAAAKAASAAKEAPGGGAKGSKDPTRKKDKSLTGYTLEQFVNDNLVPVLGFACWIPQESKAAGELRQKLKIANLELTRNMTDQLSASRISGANNKADKTSVDVDVPLQAICRVWLDKAEVEGDARQSFDFNQETKLEVKVFGYLLFPPTYNWTVREVQEAKQLSAVKPDDVKVPKCTKKGCEAILVEDEKTGEFPPHCGECGRPVPQIKKNEDTGRWHLEVEVWSVLEREMGGDHNDSQHEKKGGFAITKEKDTAGADQPKLKVKCIHMLIPKKDSGGDSMVESWMPVEDMLADIERLLTSKLEQAVQGVEFQ